MMKLLKKLSGLAAGTFMLAALTFACQDKKTEQQKEQEKDAKKELKEAKKEAREIEPKGEDPVWGKGINDKMLAVIETLDSLGPKPIQTLAPGEARMQPTPTDAVMALVSKYAIPMPTPRVDTSGQTIPVKGGNIHARIYTPTTGKQVYPVIVYYHGGGWVIATIDTYHASAQALAEQAEAIVVAVEYRKGPEYKFPTAHQDSFEAYQWVLKNAASFKGDPSIVAVVGESAGGNMAINVSIMARDKKIQMPVHQVAVYPVVNNDMNNESYQKYADAKPLSKAGVEWFVKQYTKSTADVSKSQFALVNANLKGLPSTTIIGAEIDPLASEGKLLADKLDEAKVPNTYKLYTGVVHEFFGMGLILPEARDAQALAAKELKDSFEAKAKKK